MIEHRRLYLSTHALRFGQGTRICSKSFHAIRRKGTVLVNQCVGEEGHIPMHGRKILVPVQKPVHLVDESVGLVLVEDVVGADGHKDALVVLSGFKLLAVLVEHAYLEDFVRRSGVEPLHEIVVAPKKIVRHGDDGAVFCVQMLSAFAVEQGFTVELRRAEKQKSIRTEVHSALGVINRSYGERAALTEVKIGRKRKDRLVGLRARVVLQRILKARLVVREPEGAAGRHDDVGTHGTVLQRLARKDRILFHHDLTGDEIELVGVGLARIVQNGFLTVTRHEHRLCSSTNRQRADFSVTRKGRLAFVADGIGARDVQGAQIAHDAVGIDARVGKRCAFVVVDHTERIHRHGTGVDRRTRLVLHRSEIVDDKAARQVGRCTVFVDEGLRLRRSVGGSGFRRCSERRQSGNRQHAGIRHLSR